MRLSLTHDLVRPKQLASAVIMILALMALMLNQSPTAYAESMPDIGNFVWQDLNQNGIQDAGEPGIPSIPVNLYDGTGMLVGTTLTDANGMYLFPGFPAGTYTLEVAVPSGYNLSPLGSGTATDSDFDPATNQSAAVTVTASDNLDIDAGFFLDSNALVYCDGNPFETTNWTDTFAIPTFDPALGVLLGIEFNAYAGIRQDISLESLDAQAATVVATGDGEVTITLPDGTTTIVPLTQSVSTNVSAFDGTIDFGGTSGAFIEDLVSFNSGSTIYNNFADFIGGPGVDVSVPALGEGNVTFTGAGNLVTGTNTEASAGLCVTYTYANPDIEIVKTAGDAADGDVEYIDETGAVTFTYVVMNTGNTHLSDMVILDDAGTSGDTSDDVLITAADCVDLVGPIAPGESVTCTAAIMVNGYHTNVAGTSGNPTDETGIDIPGAEDPVDLDDAVVELVSPAIDIVKTAGDAADGETEYIGGAGMVTFTYVVMNTGDTHLSDIVILDDAGTPGNTSDDVLITAAACAGLAGPVAPGGSVTCTADIMVNGDHTNVAGTSGNPTDENGNDLPDIEDPVDLDDAVVELASPAIDIVKTAGDAADGATEYIDGAGMVTFTYVVMNTGDTHLSDIVILDDAGTPGNTSDDVLITAAACAGLAGPVAPGGSVTCTADIMVNGDHTNVAGTSGNPTDENGNDLPGVEDPTDEDDAVVELASPAIEIVKTASTAEDGEVLIIPESGNVVFIYTVYNTGDTHLSDITITDDAGTPSNTSDDVTITSAQCPALAGPVEPNGKVICTAILPVGPQFDAMVYMNVADTSGNPTDENGNDLPGLNDPTDDDPAEVMIGVPDIQIIKTVETAPDGTTYLSLGPGEHTFFYAVTNTGNTYLSDITITDDFGTPNNSSDDITLTSADCGALAGPLAPQATINCFAVINIPDSFVGMFYVNIADTSGNPTNANGDDIPGLANPTDEDDAEIEFKPLAVGLSQVSATNATGLNMIGAVMIGLVFATGAIVRKSRKEA